MGIHHLTVVRDFGDYARGAHIEGDAEIARILDSEMRNHVVKVAADVKPERDAELATPPALPLSGAKADAAL